MTAPSTGLPGPGRLPEPGRRSREEGHRRFARVWSLAFRPAADPSGLEEQLLPLVRRLGDALRGSPFDPSPGRAVGSALAGAYGTDPDVLPRVLEAVDAYLLPCCGDSAALSPDEGRSRCVRLQHAVAAGFAHALRERTRAEQEGLSRAALAAREDAERALHESEARFRAVFEGAALGIGIADPSGRVLDANRALARMFGGSDHVRGRRLSEWAHPDDTPGTRRLHEELVRGERDHYRVEKPYRRSDGTVLWTDLTVSLLRGPGGEPRLILVLVEDVTERRLLNSRLRHEATHDALTGLPNRTMFFERLEQAFSPASGVRRVGLCYLDLDGFKAVNDSLGHAVGDRLLVCVAERLRDCAASSRQLVARIGGDEFVALVSDPAAPAEVAGLARRALEALSAPVRLEGRELAVRASIGVVEGPVSELTPAEMLRSADITMYRAKARGGNCYELADPDSDARAVNRHTLTTRLPAALERGEFFVEYQPLVRMADGSVEGAEALVRWAHPQHGVLGPDCFVPLAECTGLIVPLGRWVLEQAVRQACAWRGRGTGAGPLRVNVNLSPRQLRHPGLVAETAEALADAGLEPASLCLEVTESALVRADDAELKPLRQLADLGVRIALDDFGTGYSNLASLRRLPAHTLKLDRSFTRGLQHDPADPVDLKVVEGIVSLAHALDLTVTVEGVENAAQAEQLRRLGCDSAQGWYYARPGPPERLAEAPDAGR